MNHWKEKLKRFDFFIITWIIKTIKFIKNVSEQNNACGTFSTL